MDWSRVKLEVSNDLFSIERLSADDHELRLAVQCLPDESTEHYRATLYVSGAAANSTGGDRTQEDRISLEIPLHAYIPASLAVHPRTILAESMATAAPCRGDSWCWASRSSAASRSRRF